MLYRDYISHTVFSRLFISRNFFLSITNPASCLHHLLPPPRSNAVTSRLRSYDIYPRPSSPPIQNDIVPLCNMAFLTTRKGLPTVNVHPPVSFYTCWRFQLLAVIKPIIIPIAIISTRPTSIYNFYPFLSHSINSNLTVTVSLSSFIVLSSTYIHYNYSLIVSVFIVMFVLFYIHLFSYFRCKYIIKRSVQFFTSDKGGGKRDCPRCLFVCLSVSKITQNACMHLDEILHVDRCRDMDELINF